MNTKKIFLLFCGVFFCALVSAKNCGTFGQTYPVIEQNFLMFVKEKLTDWMHSDQYQQLKNRQVNTVKKHLHIVNHRFTPTNVSRVYFIDPTQTINHQPINPFDRITYRKRLVFVDTDDKAQLAWLKQFLTKWENNTVIIVGGSVGKTQKTLGQRIFADQTGEFADYFHLTHAPVIAKENFEKKQWQVEEIKID